MDVSCFSSLLSTGALLKHSYSIFLEDAAQNTISLLLFLAWHTVEKFTYNQGDRIYEKYGNHYTVSWVGFKDMFLAT